MIIINKERCPQNHLCPAVPACPAGALSQKEFQAPEIDHGHCIECEKCVKICPNRAFWKEKLP